MRPRPYQADAVDRVVDLWSQGRRRVCLSMPTGAGKTFTGMLLAAELRRDGLFAAWLTDRVDLIDQTVIEAEAAGLAAAVVRADDPRAGRSADVVIVSSQTAERRGIDPAHLGASAIIVDEAHYRRRMTARWLAAGLPALGLTATPLPLWMPDRWDELLQPLATRAAIEAGWLIEPEFVVGVPDPAAEERQHGVTDWTAAEVDALMSPHDRAIATCWRCLVDAPAAEGGFGGVEPPTIVQACTISHARHLMRALSETSSGRWATAVSGQDDAAECIARFRTGQLIGLASVAKLSVGFDVPSATIVVSARPTRRLITWIQLVGRVMRPSPLGRATVLDCAGNAERHAARLDRFWRLGADWSAAPPDAGPAPATGDLGPAPPDDPRRPVCPDCPAVVNFPGAQVCRRCRRSLAPPPPLSGRTRWTHDLTDRDIGQAVLRMALDRQLRMQADEEAAIRWARRQVHTLTGRWPKAAWPQPGWEERADTVRAHPVVARTVRRNAAAWREWMDRGQPPPGPDVWTLKKNAGEEGE